MQKEKSKLQEKVEKLFFGLYNAKKRRDYKKENGKLREKPVIFFGDSITDICDLKAYYPEFNAINRGISGNTTTDLLNRIELSVYEADPKEVVLLIGINDMMNEGQSPSMIAPRYEQIVKGIRENCPDTKIVCQSVYPGWNGNKKQARYGITFPLEYLADEIVELNVMIQKICRKYNCVYADIHSCIKRNDNTMIHDYSYDGCHPNEAGYRVISAELKKYL